MERPILETLLFSLFLLFTSLLAQNIIRNSRALKLPLISPNSPESPLYIKNLTRQQRINQLVHQTKNRLRSFSSKIISQSSSNSTQLEWMTRQNTQVKDSLLMLLKIGVGTFETPTSYKPFYFYVDTGSDITWLQCEDCHNPPNRCFGNPPEVFHNSESSTYHQIPCHTHQICDGDCEDGYCTYHAIYDDGSVAKGFLAFEKLTFDTSLRRNDDDTQDVISNIVFGCNIDHQGNAGDEGATGILGLGWGPRSIMSQINSITDDTFSYCLPRYDQLILGSQGYLQIGSEGDSLGGFRSTELQEFEGYVHYYLSLEGISVGNKRLEVSRNLFLKRYADDGTFIDSGATLSTIVPEAYKELKREIKAYIETLGNYMRFIPSQYDLALDLCYKPRGPPGPMNELPTVTFHFTGASLVLKPENVFIGTDDDPPNGFCLAIKPDNNRHTILGTYQQGNIKFIYDRRRKLLLFKDDDCHE